MALVNCKNKKFNCGPIIASTCVSYENSDNDIIKSTALPCDANLDDVFDLISSTIYTIQQSLDLSLFNPGTLAFNKTTQKIKDLLQIQTNAIIALQTIVANQATLITSLSAANLNVNIDLGIFTGQVTPVIPSTNIYTISSILNLFKNKLILLS